jgi:hypothetical protein
VRHRVQRDDHRPTPPKQKLLEERLDRIEGMVSALRGRLRWAYSIGYSSGPVPMGQGEVVMVRVRGDHTDVTATSVSGFLRQLARGQISDAARLIADMEGNGAGAHSALDRIDSLFAPQGEAKSVTGDPYRYHRKIGDAELEAARQAQKRRMSRGEGWGHS